MSTATNVSTAELPAFVRLTSEPERKAFYSALPKSNWWTHGTKKASDQGWVEVFQNSKWKCIYCERDLVASTDALVEATEEHLVPRSLLEANGADPNVAHNLGACCAGCNALKGEYVPPKEHASWRSRQAYIKTCARFISGQRLKKYLRYRDHIETALKERAGVCAKE